MKLRSFLFFPAEAASAAAPAIVIPKLADLTKAPASPPGGPTPPVPPAPPSPPVPPVTPVAPVPAAGADDVDTQIVKPRGDQSHVPTPPGGKTPADFARERNATKQHEAAKTIEEANRRAEESMVLYTQRQTEFEALEQKHKDLEAAFELVKSQAETRKTEVEGLQVQYYDTNRVTLDLNADQELQQHSTAMLQELRNNLPTRVRTAQGTESRVFFDTLLQQQGASHGLNQILDTYARAKAAGNEPSCDIAVNAFAKFLGADVDMNGNETQWKLLKSDDPTFKAVEVAMDKALPHFVSRTNRLTTFQQDAPKLARQQFDNRVIGIRQGISQQIFLAPEVAVGRLRANQDDAEALFSQIVTQVPALKAMVEQHIEAVAPTFAALSGKLNLPTLVENTPAAIQQHRQEVSRHQELLSKLMRASVIGLASPTVIAVLAAERDAAEARADAASQNTNPGGGRTGGPGPSPEPQIDTQIVKPRM